MTDLLEEKFLAQTKTSHIRPIKLGNDQGENDGNEMGIKSKVLYK